MAYLREREAFFKPESKEVRPPAINTVKVGFKRLSEDATIPTKAHPNDSGFDLVASEDVIVEPGATVVVPTGIAVQLPQGYEATVRPRSGVTAKTKLRVQLGTIDNGFSGEIGVIVDNIANTIPQIYRLITDSHDSPLGISTMVSTTVKLLDGETQFMEDKRLVAANAYLIRKGDKLAQLVITRLPTVEAIEVFDVEESDRGAKGFGSSRVTAE